MYNMPKINNKKFDVSRVCSKFNNNQELTLEAIADEFGITRDELIRRLKSGASKDEKTRVRGVINEDKNRRKRQNSSAKQKNSDKKVVIESTKENTVSTINYDAKRKALTDKIAQAERDLHTSMQKVAELEEIVAKSQQASLNIKALIESLEAEIDDLQKRIKAAKKELKDIKDTSQKATQKCEQDMDELAKVREDVRTKNDNLTLLQLELEELENHRIFLVAPSYDLTKLPETSCRFISCVELEGIELEHIESNANTLGMAETAKLMELTGMSIQDLIVAYDFAWLVWIYMSKPKYEVHVLNDDDRIQKLIDYMMA